MVDQDNSRARRGCVIGCLVGGLAFAAVVLVLSSLTSMCGVLNDPAFQAPSFSTEIWSTTTTPSASTTTGAACPGVGALETATGVPRGIRATGWADGCASEIVLVWGEVDGTRHGPFAAAKNRPDSHDRHGFDFTVSAPPGEHHFCVWSDKTGQLTPCIDVTVP